MQSKNKPSGPSAPPAPTPAVIEAQPYPPATVSVCHAMIMKLSVALVTTYWYARRQ